MAWILSNHLNLQWKFKLMAGKFTWGNKAKHWWMMSTIYLFFLNLDLKQTFPPIIWIFTESEGDEIIPRLPFKIFSPLTYYQSITHTSQWISTLCAMILNCTKDHKTRSHQDVLMINVVNERRKRVISFYISYTLPMIYFSPFSLT